MADEPPWLITFGSPYKIEQHLSSSLLLETGPAITQGLFLFAVDVVG